MQGAILTYRERHSGAPAEKDEEKVAGKWKTGGEKDAGSDHLACGLQLFLRVGGDAVSPGACRKAACGRR